jgi:TonB family protein
MARSSGGIESVKKDIERMRQKLAYNAEGTTTAEGYDNSGKRLKRVRGELNKPDLVPVQYPGTIAASYPRQAKFSRLKGNVVVEVTIDPEGKIVGSPEVSQSSGYPILNQAAVDAVSAHPFQATGKHQYYWIKLTFEPPADSTPLTPKVTPKSAPAPDAPEPSQGEAPPEPSQGEAPPEPSQGEAPPEPSQEEAAPSSDEAT